MFIIVSETYPQEEDLSSVVTELTRDNIPWFEIPANTDEIKDGKAIARFIPDKEFYEEFRLEDSDMEKQYRVESYNVEKWLKERHGTNINTN